MLTGCTLNHVVDIVHIDRLADTVPQWSCQSWVRGQDLGCHFCVCVSLLNTPLGNYIQVSPVCLLDFGYTYILQMWKWTDRSFICRSANPLSCKSFRYQSHSRKIYFSALEILAWFEILSLICKVISKAVLHHSPTKNKIWISSWGGPTILLLTFSLSFPKL